MFFSSFVEVLHAVNNSNAKGKYPHEVIHYYDKF